MAERERVYLYILPILEREGEALQRIRLILNNMATKKVAGIKLRERDRPI